MSTGAFDAIIADYFERLDAALDALAPAHKAQLIDEIREHVTEALADLPEETEVAVRDVLERVGSPADIAAEALGDDDSGAVAHDGVAPDQTTGRAPGGARRLPKPAIAGASILALVAIVVLIVVLATGSASNPGPATVSGSPATSTHGAGFATGISVTGVNPSGGQTFCATAVQISGTAFTPTSHVYFGSKAAVSVLFTSSTSITAFAPPSNAGNVDITVASDGGTSMTTSADRYTYRSSPSSSGVRMLSGDGAVYGFGSSCYLGAPFPSAGWVALTSTPDNKGYWEVGALGVVSAFGDAPTFSQSPQPEAPAVSIASTRDGRGYWLLTARGDVLGAGDALLYGSPAESGQAAGLTAKQLVATPDGKGYWVLESDGSILPYGDAPSLTLHGAGVTATAVGMAVTTSGRGAWVVGTDGIVATYGDAPSLALTGGAQSAQPVAGITASSDGKGFSLVTADGKVQLFGNATDLGSLANSPPPSPIVAVG